ncbi:ComEC/Rec2 family competence protein [Cohnella thailandensis]|uniref:ComEC/Rec2 family competence protein n=1 Tax=Cohnella thailandensis TaxID=557557 RepID=A0A841SZ70_9BACL|nr:ComEC/Rec2 family competence protein [Cohnella thailandensis]MBB6636179.1 ComEC/Rec2 family competence protein [Cohnella thailandensis]MBP1973852.1 competence protein ComEC [Cohnella thailandensis]
MSRRPLVAFMACWTLGASIYSLFQGASAIGVLFGALLLLAAYALAVPASRRLVAACAAALLLSAGERVWMDARHGSDITPLLGGREEQPAIVRGRLDAPAAIDGEVVTFELQGESIELGENGADGSGASSVPIRDKLLVRIWLQEEEEQRIAASWRRGDEAVIQGELQLPADAGNFGGFDYRSYLRSLDIHWSLTAKGASAVSVQPSDPPWRLLPLRLADSWREKLGGWMDRLYEGTDRGYMKGLVLGIEDDLDPEQFAAFSRLGLTHVLAISGLHVGVVVYILLQAASMLRLPRERGQELAIAALPAYMLLTGASPSAVRACLMAMLALYMARRNQLKDGLHLLSAAALVMMMLEPRVVENVSFQLSFVVTAGLLLFVPGVNDWLAPLVRWKSMRGALAVTLTATAVSFPISIYYFHQFHLLSFAANLLLVPFISFVIMPLGMASLALAGLWYPLGRMTARIASWGNGLTDLAIAKMESINGLQTYWPQPSLLWVFAAYALLFATFGALNRLYTWKHETTELRDKVQIELRALRVPPRSGTDRIGEDTVPLAEALPHPLAANTKQGKRKLLLLMACWGVWLAWGIQPAALDRDAKVMFLDVGQGDSILLRSGTGKFGLIDAGGTVQFGKKEEWKMRRDPYEVGLKTVVPLLKQRGVRSLDWLVLSHLDQDHIGGALAVLEHFPVKRLFFNGTVKEDDTARELFELAERRGIPMFSLRQGMSWAWDRSSSLQVLYPPNRGEAGVEIEPEQNDRSVVLLLTMYGRTFLLPGDLEKKGEAELLVAAAGDTKSVDVLKAGHHGSKTSTTEPWLREWAPGEVVISAGRNNLYGHPHSDVLGRLEELRIPYYRTDLNGEIQYRVSPRGELIRRTKREPESESRLFYRLT